MTIVLILFALPAALYGAIWLGAWRAATGAVPVPAAPGAPAYSPAEPAARWLLPVAIVLHGASLVWPWDRGGFHYGFAKALSATVWVGLALLWFEGRRASLEALRLLVGRGAHVRNVLFGGNGEEGWFVDGNVIDEQCGNSDHHGQWLWNQCQRSNRCLRLDDHQQR